MYFLIVGDGDGESDGESERAENISISSCYS